MRAKYAYTLIPALVLLAGCEIDDLGGVGRYHEDFHYNYPLKTGGRLAVESFNGSIEITPWDQETVDISGTKYARTQEDAADLKIEVEHTRDGASIRAARPGSRYGNAGARFVIKAPRSVVMERVISSNGAIRVSDGMGPGHLKTSNGAINLAGFDGELRAETSNGTIRGERLRGPLNASTSNGGIHLTLERAQGSVTLGTSNGSIEVTLPAGEVPNVRAHTSNGGITLHLPETANARIEASTSNSSITTDFEMRMRGEINKHHLEGTMGSGGPLIDLSTSNGGIRIIR